MLRRVHGIEVELRSDGSAAAAAGPRDVEVLRIAHEAMHNAVRHAAASRVTVRLQASGEMLTLEVDDDGIGFDPEDPELRSRHLGLTSMEERARQLGGSLTLSSTVGAGTTVKLQVGRNGR